MDSRLAASASRSAQSVRPGRTQEPGLSVTLVMLLAEFMRGATVVMPEAAARVTVVMVVMHGVMRRGRLFRQGDGASRRNHA